MKKVHLKLLALTASAVLTAGFLTGCTFKYDEFNRRVMEEGETYSVSYAQIISATPITIKVNKYDSDTATTVGVVGGAVVGGVIGYNSHHHDNDYFYSDGWHDYYEHDRSGSAGGMLVGGLIGAGVGYLAGKAVEGANNISGLRLNLKGTNGENFAIDVPEAEGLVSGAYVQVNTTQSGYSQVIPITEDAYRLAVSGN